LDHTIIFEETFALLIPALIIGYGSVQTSKTWRFINFTFIRSFRNSFPSELLMLFMVEVESGCSIMKSGKVAVLALIGNSTSAIALQDQHLTKTDYA
jgi:glyceraldehyde-3-phosphate dehydrogenase (NADP+)